MGPLPNSMFSLKEEKRHIHREKRASELSYTQTSFILESLRTDKTIKFYTAGQVMVGTQRRKQKKLNEHHGKSSHDGHSGKATE